MNEEVAVVNAKSLVLKVDWAKEYKRIVSIVVQKVTEVDSVPFGICFYEDESIRRPLLNYSLYLSTEIFNDLC
ncbi:MAG: hypothetical protein IPK55_11630 [Streptococcus sp.]|nr:hypothetical protein [Streptococcus sp.]